MIGRPKLSVLHPQLEGVTIQAHQIFLAAFRVVRRLRSIVVRLISPKNKESLEKIPQVFRNKTDKPMFIFLEMSTSHYRVDPGDELILWYEPKRTKIIPPGAPINVEIHEVRGHVQVTIYTDEDELFHLDGQVATMNFDVS